jgi:hypothetical protein
MELTAKAVFVAVLVLAAGGVCVAQGQKAGVREQMSFSQDAPLQHPVALSPDVLRVLFETEEARQVLNFASDAAHGDPARLFRATEVHLSSPDEVDLVVIGVSPMRGADCGWFWVVRSARNDPKVVLFANANSLELTESGTNGYRDILTAWSSATETNETAYRFDGKNYKVWKKMTQNRD